MNKEANTDTIPIDLIPDILSRLPAKSIERFRCVSKLWDSIIRRPYFTELFRTRSSSNPRLLIGVEQDGEWFFFSTPQPQNSYEKSSSLVVAADLHMKFSGGCRSPYYCSYASGLIYFPNTRISKEDDYLTSVICNPSTGQFAILPRLPYQRYYGFLGFDPIGKQFKVLDLNHTNDDDEHILTLGTEKARWRMIQCSLTHLDFDREICINGVLYYLALPIFDERTHQVIVCFDVRSEKLKILYLKLDFFRNGSTKLINYKGILGVISLKDVPDGGFSHKLFMWVLEDVEKHTWSSYVYTLKAKDNVLKVNDNLSVVGATARGEIVLAKTNAWNLFYVFYFNPEMNTLRTLEIQGVSKEEEWIDNHKVYVFLDHVEDLQFDIMKTTYADHYQSKAHQREDRCSLC